MKPVGAAFISSTFWWLDYYAELREHLQRSGRLIRGNEAVLIGELPAIPWLAATVDIRGCE